MEKRYKNNYFTDMLLLAKECVENLTLAEKIITVRNSEEKINKTDNPNLIFKISNNLEKDYFTPIEREDIFSICCHLYELNETAVIMYAISREKDIFLISDELAALLQMIKNMAEMISEIISSLSKYPKHNDLTSNFVNIEKQYSLFNKKLHFKNEKQYDYVFSVIKKCADCCHLTAIHIQYVLIKNS